jgi:photosystem II stability/assembly factor-like uncharacterized protein
MAKRSKKLVGVGIVAVITIGIVALALQNNPDVPSETASSDPRTVFWRHIHGLGIDPADRSILYIATHGDFYQSTNGGPPVKVDQQRADYMAFNAPLADGIPLYASGHPSTGGNTGLIKSMDGGKTWSQVATVLDPPVDFHAMATGKSDPNVIIGYDSGGRGLFRTTDAGNTWDKLPDPDYITSLAIDPTDSNAVFAGFAGAQKGFGISKDGGTSWTLLDSLKGLTIYTLAIDERGMLYAYTSETGLSKSADKGQTWEKINIPKFTVMTMTVDSQNDVIYIGGYVPDGYQEVYKSSDGGANWDLIGTNKEL